MITEQFTDVAGFIRIKWQSQATFLIHSYKFRTHPTTQELQALSDASDAEIALNSLDKIDLTISTERGTIVQFIERVKANPTVTLAQYNTFLAGLQWYQQTIIRTFVFVMAQRLAERRDVTLTDLTETVVLRAVRDYIVSKTSRQLARILFNLSDL